MIGPAAWSDDTERVVNSAFVTDNTFHGEHFGYALVVASADRFTVMRNYVGDNVAFGGVPGVRCPKAPPNAPPMPFLLNKGSAKGDFQEDFVNGEVQHSKCSDEKHRVACRGVASSLLIGSLRLSYLHRSAAGQ